MEVWKRLSFDELHRNDLAKTIECSQKNVFKSSQGRSSTEASSSENSDARKLVTATVRNHLQRDAKNLFLSQRVPPGTRFCLHAYKVDAQLANELTNNDPRSYPHQRFRHSSIRCMKCHNSNCDGGTLTTMNNHIRRTHSNEPRPADTDLEDDLFLAWLLTDGWVIYSWQKFCVCGQQVGIQQSNHECRFGSKTIHAWSSTFVHFNFDDSSHYMAPS